MASRFSPPVRGRSSPLYIGHRTFAHCVRVFTFAVTPLTQRRRALVSNRQIVTRDNHKQLADVQLIFRQFRMQSIYNFFRGGATQRFAARFPFFAINTSGHTSSVSLKRRNIGFLPGAWHL